jgi:hypothetical protein
MLVVVGDQEGEGGIVTVKEVGSRILCWQTVVYLDTQIYVYDKVVYNYIYAYPTWVSSCNTGEIRISCVHCSSASFLILVFYLAVHDSIIRGSWLEGVWELPVHVSCKSKSFPNESKTFLSTHSSLHVLLNHSGNRCEAIFKSIRIFLYLQVLTGLPSPEQEEGRSRASLPGVLVPGLLFSTTLTLAS